MIKLTCKNIGFDNSKKMENNTQQSKSYFKCSIKEGRRI